MDVAIGDLDVTGQMRPCVVRHVQVLAAVLDDTGPILVRAGTLQVLDGFHRIEAARSLGRSHVRVQWVEGTEAEAWERAISTNSRHGLPLSAHDRREAVSRLLALAPEWSDRRIAAAAGVDSKTVARRRRDEAERSGAETPHLNARGRVGRDGKSYPSPADAAKRREEARRVIAGDPERSDRDVAREVGLSPATVREVRSASSSPGRPPDTTAIHRRIARVARVARWILRLLGIALLRRPRR